MISSITPVRIHYLRDLKEIVLKLRCLPVPRLLVKLGIDPDHMSQTWIQRTSSKFTILCMFGTMSAYSNAINQHYKSMLCHPNVWNQNTCKTSQKVGPSTTITNFPHVITWWVWHAITIVIIYQPKTPKFFKKKTLIHLCSLLHKLSFEIKNHYPIQNHKLLIHKEDKPTNRDFPIIV